MRKILILLSLAGTIFSACKKTHQDPALPTPVFEADIAGVRWTADSIFAARLPENALPEGAYFEIAAKKADGSLMFLQTYNDTVSTQTFREESALITSFESKLDVPDSNYITITWIAASETNTNRFEIERGYDGINFTKAGEVPAKGNSTNEHTYAFSEKPGLTDPFNTKIYYRLRIVDNDSTVKYSSIIVVRYATPALYVFSSGDFAFGYNGTITVTSVDKKTRLISGNFHFSFTDDSNQERIKVENGIFKNIPY